MSLTNYHYKSRVFLCVRKMNPDDPTIELNHETRVLDILSHIEHYITGIEETTYRGIENGKIYCHYCISTDYAKPEGDCIYRSIHAVYLMRKFDLRSCSVCEAPIAYQHKLRECKFCLYTYQDFTSNLEYQSLIDLYTFSVISAKP